MSNDLCDLSGDISVGDCDDDQYVELSYESLLELKRSGAVPQELCDYWGGNYNE